MSKSLALPPTCGGLQVGMKDALLIEISLRAEWRNAGEREFAAALV